MATPEGATIAGIYMEGPYMNPKYGANAEKNKWRGEIKREDYAEFLDEGADLIKVWAIAPEREGIAGFMADAKLANPSVTFAVGHSEATPMQIKAMGKYKPTLATHTTNATGKQTGGGGVVGYGPDEFALKDNEVYCELISDSLGIHVHREIEQLIIHSKGVDRVCLITDGSCHKNPVPEKYKGVTDINFSPAGEIAGSRLTMNMACKNVMSHTRVGITEVFLMASRNPARVIGLDDEIGTVEVGKIADLVIVDDKFNVAGVILGGRKVR
jgi:N-acetylglucosamine-6-phosphate deacetylase